MKYISLEQIQESINALVPFNPFFAITYLVLKRENVPVGSGKQFHLDNANREFLTEHFRVHPQSSLFFRVTRPSDRNKHWVASNYASTGLQSINTRTFRDAVRHQHRGNSWGWSEDYIERLTEKLPSNGEKIPLLHLGVWLYKNREWEDDNDRNDIVELIIDEYGITDREIDSLFQTSIKESALAPEQAFYDKPFDWRQLLADYTNPTDVPPETSGILRYLESRGVGPIANLVFHPAERLNVITGDNGLGKTFLLDLAWWALTGDWAERQATPFDVQSPKPPVIEYSVAQRGDSRPVTAEYSYPASSWETQESRPTLSGLVVYVRLDGSFAIWDPMNHTLYHFILMKPHSLQIVPERFV